jgi:hypothetical protein
VPVSRQARCVTRARRCWIEKPFERRFASRHFCHLGAKRSLMQRTTMFQLSRAYPIAPPISRPSLCAYSDHLLLCGNTKGFRGGRRSGGRQRTGPQSPLRTAPQDRPRPQAGQSPPAPPSNTLRPVLSHSVRRPGAAFRTDAIPT